MPQDVENVEEGAAVLSIPPPNAVPEEGSLPAQHKNRKNLAGDKALCDKFLKVAGSRWRHFDSQDQRQAQMESQGVMDTADRMYRVALNRDTANPQHMNTKSDVTSTMFFRIIRTVHSAIK